MEMYFNKDMLIAEIQKEALQIEAKVSKVAAEKIKTITTKAYDDIIDQYYLYKTTSYYRHKTGIGTGTGWNLYQSNDISLYPNSGDRYFGLDININADDMKGYYRFSKQKVLENVLSGIRGVPGFSWVVNKQTNRHMMLAQRETEFSAKIKVNGQSFTGTPNQILHNLKTNIPKYYRSFWSYAWYQEVKHGNYVYFKNKKKFGNR